MVVSDGRLFDEALHTNCADHNGYSIQLQPLFIPRSPSKHLFLPKFNMTLRVMAGIIIAFPISDKFSISLGLADGKIISRLLLVHSPSDIMWPFTPKIDQILEKTDVSLSKVLSITIVLAQV